MTIQLETSLLFTFIFEWLKSAGIWEFSYSIFLVAEWCIYSGDETKDYIVHTEEYHKAKGKQNWTYF
jgi:hypothetical protein